MKPGGTESKASILIAEDEPTTRAQLSAIFRTMGLEAITAADGAEAIELYEKSRPAICILDIQMPKLSGIEVLNHIRTSASVLEVPVIMCTANDRDSSISEALELGANDYILKPASPKVASARIRTHLALAAMSRENAKQQKVAALSAMIVTYNHEINNPLTTAMYHVGRIVESSGSSEQIAKSGRAAEEALKRMASIIRDIQNLRLSEVIETEYADGVSMIALPGYGPKD